MLILFASNALFPSTTRALQSDHSPTRVKGLACLSWVTRSSANVPTRWSLGFARLLTWFRLARAHMTRPPAQVSAPKLLPTFQPAGNILLKARNVFSHHFATVAAFFDENGTGRTFDVGVTVVVHLVATCVGALTRLMTFWKGSPALDRRINNSRTAIALGRLENGKVFLFKNGTSLQRKLNSNDIIWTMQI